MTIEPLQSAWACPIPDSEIVRIVDEIDHYGFSCINDYVSQDELEPVRALAWAAIERNGGGYVGFVGVDAVVGTVLAKIPAAPTFRDLCERIYKAGTGKTPPEAGFYQLLRCLAGAAGQANSYVFHYDTYVLTILLPVSIPGQFPYGDLLMFPNGRPVRRFYLSNLLDKVLVDNRFAQTSMRRIAQMESRNLTAIRLRPGNLYLFWGYRSIHTNEPGDPHALRATALWHYGDPHENSFLRAIIRRARRLPTA